MPASSSSSSSALLRDAFIGAGIAEGRAHALALLVESTIEGLLLIARAYRDTRPVMIVAAELESAVTAAIPPCRP